MFAMLSYLGYTNARLTFSSDRQTGRRTDRQTTCEGTRRSATDCI